MRLRTQLTFAFLLLAVVPLGVVVLYSYNSSISAFRRAVEAESGVLAEELGGRMESVRKDLNHRMERLREFPFRSLMGYGGRGQGAGAGNFPWRERLLVEIGEAAPFMEALEFKPVGPPPEAAAEHPRTGRAPRAPRTPPAPPPPPLPDSLVIRLGADREVPVELQAKVDEARRMVMHLRVPGMSGASEAVGDAKTLQEATAAATRAVEAARRSVLEELKASAEVNKALVEAKAGRLEQATTGEQLACPVTKDGQVIGTVTAQVSSRRVLRSVLSRTQRKQGEIPFAIDAKNEIHTVDPGDKGKLEMLPIAGAAAGKADKAAPGVEDWVVVTRKDQDSGITFGIARPIGDSLKEIRRTAARNLGFGVAMIGLALLGILPLSGRMTRNLATLAHGVEEISRGKLDTRVPVRTNDEIGRLSRAFNRMAEELGRHQKNLVEQERLRKELEMCRKIQEELLPRHPLSSPFVQVNGVCIPAREVGGDFFNYFPLPDGSVGLLVGDVSGKGLPAALLMANLQATIQGRLPLEPNLAVLAGVLDHDIEASTPPELYLTLFLGIFDVHKGVLRYVNAGHHTQFALRPDGTVERLESTGRPLGLLPGGGYIEKCVALPAGSALFLYTDGLVEAENPGGEQFGMKRLEEIVVRERTDEPQQMLARIDDAVRGHRGPVEAADDATMLILKVGAPGLLPALGN